jgi:PPK2 family polyphosphate:nucleotide phosphotransferase
LASVKLDDFRVPLADAGKKSRDKFRLEAFDPAAKPFSSGSKDADRARISTTAAQLGDLQNKLHAQRRQRVLLILQGMDTSGKDGTIRAVFREVSPLGLRIEAFGVPSANELAHDFLWRVHARTPAAGQLAIFNRSHYEDVLVPRITGAIDSAECERRYAHIRAFEALLAQNHTTIVKCFLHISKQAQRERLQARLDDPDKHWKFDPSDLEAREKWPDYQAAYQDALTATSTEHAPWYVVPADSKTHRNVMVSALMLRALEGLDLRYPASQPGLPDAKIQ